jgi:hypothetical protein
MPFITASLEMFIFSFNGIHSILFFFSTSFPSADFQLTTMIYSLGIFALLSVLSAGQGTPSGIASLPLAYGRSILRYILRVSLNISLTDACVVVVPIGLADFQNITLYSQYAAAAYCDANNNDDVSTNITLTCAGAIRPGGLNASNCPMVEANGARTIVKISK